MFKKLLKKLSPTKKSLEKGLIPTGKSLRMKCQNITQQFPSLAESNYFTTHLPLILQPQSIISVLEDKVKRITNGFKQNPTYEIQLASIILNITEENGLFYVFVKLWISFCHFQLKKIVSDQQKGEKMIEQGEFQKNIVKFFHKEIFFLCYFLYELCLYLYESIFEERQNQLRELFHLIRNTVTTLRQWSQIHQIFRKEIKCKQQHFTEAEVNLNMKQLDKVCKMSQIPVPLMDSINILNQFVKSPAIEDKVRKCVVLIEKLKQEMLGYRKVNNMGAQYVFCADDVLSALTFAMWRLRKNIYGACVYAETVLCCQFQSVDEQKLAGELNSFGDNVRHSFDTVRSVARIGLLQESQIYFMI